MAIGSRRSRERRRRTAQLATRAAKWLLALGFAFGMESAIYGSKLCAPFQKA